MWELSVFSVQYFCKLKTSLKYKVCSLQTKAREEGGAELQVRVASISSPPLF